MRPPDPPIHKEVLRTARRICRERGGWTFSPVEIVQALPHLNASSVRTHIVSRCCMNAPVHHAHKWDYFRRVERGVYKIEPPYRRESKAKRTAETKPLRVAETAKHYTAEKRKTLKDSIHAVVTRDAQWFVGECLEVAVVTQGRTLSEVIQNLQEAVGLHLEGEDTGNLGLTDSPRLVVTYEIPNVRDGAPA